MQIRYTLLKVCEVWQYDTVTKYDPITGEDGLFAPYMNTFMKMKMEASGYPSHSDTDQEKNKYIKRVRAHEGITLRPYDISFKTGRCTYLLTYPLHPNVGHKATMSLLHR